MIDLKETKNKIFKKENFYSLIIILIFFTIDRYSKVKIINNLNDKAYYINDFINFDLTWNTGIGFGLLSSDSIIFYNIISAIIGCVIIILIYMTIKEKLSNKIILSLILGGAMGNFYDRITFFAVPDFIDFHYKSFHWFTFNIADIFITIGIILLLGNDIFLKKND